MVTVLALAIFAMNSGAPLSTSDAARACQILSQTFAAEARGQLERGKVTAGDCAKMRSAMKICGAAFSLPSNDTPQARAKLCADLKSVGCGLDQRFLSNEEASFEIMKNVLQEWPQADGTKFSVLSDEILFALYISPSSLAQLRSTDKVYRDWLSQVGDLSFAGLPERKASLEEFKKALCEKLAPIPSASELVEKLKSITYRSWD